jgi:formylglycine-generating enzyme required for sulfatase activity
MAGNVYEWCWDWHEIYASGSQTNPRGSTSGTRRVCRGGGWSNIAKFSRVAYRYDYDPWGSNRDDLGFRVARSSAP